MRNIVELSRSIVPHHTHLPICYRLEVEAQLTWNTVRFVRTQMPLRRFGISIDVRATAHQPFERTARHAVSNMENRGADKMVSRRNANVPRLIALRGICYRYILAFLMRKCDIWSLFWYFLCFPPYFLSLFFVCAIIDVLFFGWEHGAIEMMLAIRQTYMTDESFEFYPCDLISLTKQRIFDSAGEYIDRRFIAVVEFCDVHYLHHLAQTLLCYWHLNSLAYGSIELFRWWYLIWISLPKWEISIFSIFCLRVESQKYHQNRNALNCFLF